MSTYKNLIGKDVNFLTTDPTTEAAEGQIWYNSTSGVFKDLLVGSAWSSGSNLVTYRYGGAGGGTQTAAFVGGGYKSPAPDPVNVTEEYNGSGWTTGGNMNTARMYIGGSGTQTAGLASGGDQYPSPRYSALVEEYNGTAWSVQNVLPAGNKNMGSCGIQTASLNIGGSTPSATNVTNLYDGTNWTNTGHNLNTARLGLRAVGTTTSALVNGGSPNVATTEEYNGSSWTSVNNSTNTFDAHASAGTQTAAAMFGGGNPSGGVSTDHNQYDGTTWTSAPSLAIGRYYAAMGPIGTQSSALCAGGNGPDSAVAGVATEEYNQSLNVITAGAWSAGGTIPYNSPQKNGSGILTAAFVVGGETPPGAMVNTSVKYDGTSWTATNNINSARGDVMAAGTLTAGLIMGGYQNVPDPNFLFEETEEFNGTSWSEVNDMPTGAYSGSGTGTQTAAFVNNMYIGSPGERTNVTYEYDGTNWTNGGNTAQTTNSRSSVGTLTAGLTVGGRPAPSTFIDKTELYDGTSWTSGVDMISEFQAGGQSSKGTQSDCIIFGSPRSPANTDAFKTDGTTWFTSPSMASNQNNGTGTSTAALAFGNSDGSQEFTGETSALNIKTITTS